MISFDPKFFKAAVRSSLDKIWQRRFEERFVEVCYNMLVRELKEKQRKLSRLSKTKDLIDAMTNRNVRNARVKSIRV